MEESVDAKTARARYLAQEAAEEEASDSSAIADIRARQTRLEENLTNLEAHLKRKIDDAVHEIIKGK